MSYAGNPRAPKDDTRIEEGTGMVTSDSLAAESLKSGGSFADGDATAASVPSHATTANTTDTSGATILPAVPDATHRSAGVEDYCGNDSNQSVSSTSGAYDTSKGGPQESDGGAAPTYVATVTGDAQHAENLKPKGKNITEGGFDSDAPNASFNANIGPRQDPGRQAEDEMLKANARSGADAAYPGAGTGVVAGGTNDKGGFEKLGDEAA